MIPIAKFVAPFTVDPSAVLMFIGLVALAVATYFNGGK